MTFNQIKDVKEGRKLLQYNGNLYECVSDVCGSLTFQNVNDDYSFRICETRLYADKQNIFESVRR